MGSNSFTESLLRDLEDNENGSFQLENIGGKAYLSVSPPGTKGLAVTTDEIITRINLFGIENYSKLVVETIARKAEGKPVEIGVWKGGQPEEAKIEIEINQDKMSASIFIIPPRHGGKIPLYEDLLQALEAAGVRSGINHDALKEIATSQLFLKRVNVAEGTDAVKGVSGYILTHFNSLNAPELVEDQSGKVDYKNIRLIQNVTKGDLLAEMVSSSPGKPGYTVTGETIEPGSAQEAKWKPGANVRLSEDNTRLYAEITGRPVQEKNGTIKVDEICYLDNVNFSTGNVDFPGTIIVEGTVEDDFRLNTSGSIIIKKSVGRVFFKAGGDIILSGGVMGKNGGLIESDGDIYVKFSEQGKLIARGNIFIEEASMHSELIAGDSIHVLGGRGEIIGGEVIAGGSIFCNKLGAIVETRTLLMSGTPPELIAELEKIKEEILKKKETLVKIKQSLSKLSDEASRRNLNDEEESMLEKLNLLREKYEGLVHSLTVQYDTALSFYEPDQDSFVSVEKVIYPGVEINLGNGKIFKSSLREIQGKSYIFTGANGMVTHSSSPPPKKKKRLT